MVQARHLSREQHLAVVCGTGTGPDVWRDGQKRQALLAEQTADLAKSIDDLGRDVVRPRLADALLPILDLIDSEYLFGPPAMSWQPIVWGFTEALRAIGRALEDPQMHAQDVMRRARDLLDSIDQHEPDRLRTYTPWPRMDMRHRDDVRAWLRDVVALPWATPSATESPLLVGLVTGATREIEQYRDLRMLPLVAQRERRPMLNALRLYLDGVSRRDGKGATYCRYLVITSGARVPFGGDLQGRIRSMQRLISRWAVVSAAEHQIDVVYRGTEMTNDNIGAHVHANVIVEPRCYIGAAAWTEYLTAMRRHFGVWVRDNGRVSDPAEIVKYVCKPTEIFEHFQSPELPKETKNARLEWLYRALYKARLVAPMGAMRELWQQIETDKMKPLVIGGVVKLVPKSTPAERSKDKKPVGENVIVGHVLSNRVHTPWAEPSVLILGYNKNPATKAGQRNLGLIAALGQTARAAWDANRAPAPATATAIAAAWLNADSDNSARGVHAIPRRPDAKAGGNAAGGAPAGAGAMAMAAGDPLYIVHTTSVTVPAISDSPGGSSGHPPGKGFFDIPPGCFVDGNDLIDSETGEILGQYRGRAA